MSGRQVKRIKLPREEEGKAVQEIVRYFAEERNEQIGNLEASLVLDFILDKIGPAIYNQAIYDIHNYMNEKVEDLFGLTL